MNDETTGPLDRAVAEVRDEPPSLDGWDTTRRSVMGRVRSTVRPGRTFTVDTDPDGALTQVNERVVVALLRAHLTVPGTVSVDAVRTQVEGDRCAGVEIDVVARYGQDLDGLAGGLLERARQVLAGVLLGSAVGLPVHVQVVDVTTDHLDL